MEALHMAKEASVQEIVVAGAVQNRHGWHRSLRHRFRRLEEVLVALHGAIRELRTLRVVQVDDFNRNLRTDLLQRDVMDRHAEVITN